MPLTRFQQHVVSATLDETAQAVAQRLREHHVGCVVVVREGRPVGLLTDRDLALRVVAEGRDPRAVIVSDIVTYDAATLPSDATTEEAARTMRAKGVRRLPIVSADGRVVGIVTADDLVELLSQQLADVGRGIAGAVDATDSR